MNFSNPMFAALVIVAINMALGHTALAQTRLGLHVTQEELNIWKQRAASGPYKSVGDASTNSPGDWDRIVANRNAFASNPSNGRWTSGPNIVNGCADVNTNPPNWGSTDWAIRLRDAAFHNRVMGVTTDHGAIKNELLWLVNQSWAQFGDPNGIWCFGVFWDRGGSFIIASWLTRILFAYDYVGRSTFTQAELDKIDRWFFNAADFWRRDVDHGLNGVFVDRWNGNYARREACESPTEPYVGGPLIYSYAKHMNNRRGAILRFSALTGVHLTHVGRSYTNGRYGTLAEIVQSGKMFVQEFIRFGVFPQGVHGDFERRSDIPDLGWAYAGATLAEVMAIADAFARVGNTSLYTYNTNLGDCGTQGTINDGGDRVGQNRDLLFALESYMNYPTDVYDRYWPTAGNQDYRIDGRNPRSGSSWHSLHDTMAIMGNVFFQDMFVKEAYTRTHLWSLPYPPNPASIGAPQWMGENGIFPAVLFMFGQMEGKVWPYEAGEPPPPPPSAPTNLRVISAE